MTWNYRIMKKKIDGEDSYGIHEVYYNDSGSIYAFSSDPDICADSLEELDSELQHMMAATTKPILDWETALEEAQNTKA